MAQQTGQNLPPPQSPFVTPETGILSYDGYQYLLSTIDQLSSEMPTATITTGLVSTGTNQATALLLSTQWNEVDTVASGTGVLLASFQPGQAQTVFNGGSNPLLVYPPPGLQINALVANAPFTINAGSSTKFDTTSATQIRT